ncbi:Acylglycerol kinase, mitochondrial, partial [Lemmus lemmus]
AQPPVGIRGRWSRFPAGGRKSFTRAHRKSWAISGGQRLLLESSEGQMRHITDATLAIVKGETVPLDVLQIKNLHQAMDGDRDRAHIGALD